MENILNPAYNQGLISSAVYLYVNFMQEFIYLYQFMLVITPVLCLFYIIFGGIKFSASSGNKERVKSAKRTVTAAITGCLVVILAYPLLNLIAYIFTPENSTVHFLDWYADIVTLVALIYIVWGGIQYTTSSGKPLEILEAKRTIFYALQGYVWMLIIRLLFTWLSG